MTANQNPNSEIGGVTAKSLSIPQLSPVFYYPTESGEILVYVVKVGRTEIVIINLDVVREESYGSKAILDPTLDTFSLVKIAEKNYRHSLMPNPFTRLFNDSQAMTKLMITLREALSGE